MLRLITEVFSKENTRPLTLEEKNDLRFSWIVITIAFAILWLISPPHFTETNDDAVMASFSYGYDGNYSAHLMYIHIFVGALLKALMTICPFIPWYSVLQIAIIYISLIMLLFVILRNRGDSTRAIPTVLMLLPFGYQLISSLQFTKTAGVAIIAGAMLLLWATDNALHAWTKVLSITLIVIGSMYRFLVFEMLLIPISGYVFYIMSYRVRGRWMIDWRRILVPFTIAFVLCVGCRFANRAIYQLDEGWAYSLNNNRTRVELISYGFPNYDENQSLYESLGITREDLALYRIGGYGDPSFFTVEAMKQLIAVKVEEPITAKLLVDGIKTLIAGYIKYDYFSVLAFSILWALLEGMRDKRRAVFVGYQVISFIAVQIYLFVSGRFLQARVDICYALALFAIFAVEVFDFSVLGKDGRLSRIVIVLILAMHLSTYVNDYRSYKADVRKSPSDTFELLATDTNHFYLYLPLWNTLPDKIYNAFEFHEKGYASNMTTIGSWRFNTPPIQNVLRRWKLTNPYSGMVNKDHVFLLSVGTSAPKRVLTHIQQHYHVSAQLHRVKRIGSKYNLYLISTRKGPRVNIEETIKDDDTIRHDVVLESRDSGGYTVSGLVYKPGQNSLSSTILIGLVNTAGERKYKYTLQTDGGSEQDLMNGRFGSFSAVISDTYEDLDCIEVYLRFNGKTYLVDTIDVVRDVSSLYQETSLGKDIDYIYGSEEYLEEHGEQLEEYGERAGQGFLEPEDQG